MQDPTDKTRLHLLRLAAGATLAALALATTGCTDEHADAAETIEDTAEDAADAVGDAAQNIQDGVEDAAENVEDAADGH
ncbi:hypothetical protein [Engelhardtia mirabilis]|uniref:YtxH-like protein n=1 Tax=Engelhardtia mirabilis TaxID=2528011 RepID=A0A518BSX7_9BACT|nr:hypothetical protein Pla133_51950 [Planctomycetes bacterium Pla133]QDV04397.1 hypothetical protein Pla86_51920 [Planctomycetes bacterium Pla86]